MDSTFPSFSEVDVLFQSLEYLNEVFGGIEFVVDPKTDIDVFVGVFYEEQQDDLSLAQEFYTRCSDIRKRKGKLLVFVKRASNSHLRTSLGYSEIKRKLFRMGNVYFFKGQDDLVPQFSKNFINVIRGPIFDKLGVGEQHALHMNALKILSQGVLGDYINIIGQSKYLKDVYVKRGLENEINRFIRSDEWFLEEVGLLLTDLEIIASQFNLTNALDIVIRCKVLFLDFTHLSEQHLDAVEDLKSEFAFPLVEEIYRKTLDVVTSDINAFQVQFEKLCYSVAQLPHLVSTGNNLKAILAELRGSLFEIFRQGSVNKNYLYEAPVKYALSTIVPGKKIDERNYLLINDLLNQLNLLITEQSKRCLAIIGKAGFGKTNLICNLSKELSKNHPVIVFNSNLLENYSSLDDTIQNYWGVELQQFFAGWLSRLDDSKSPSEQNWLFVFMDGINEHSNIVVFAQRLKLFLGNLRNVRVKVIITCRDISWEMFAASLGNYLFADHPFELGEYHEAEWQNAIQKYFREYSITGDLENKALVSFRNPLLLRFFCEANSGQILRDINDVQLISIFDLYLSRLTTNISQRMGFLGHDLVLEFLTSISNFMWEKASTQILIDDLGITKDERAKFTSLYNLIRDENVILTDYEQHSNLSRGIHFVYDAFMEYILAKGWLSRLQKSMMSDNSIDKLLQEIIERLDNFPAGLNAIVILDNMLGKNGNILSKLLKYISFSNSDLLVLRQITVVNWFASIEASNTDEGLIIALDKFEQIARDDIKEKLSSHIIRLLEGQSNSLVARRILTRILDIKSIEASLTPKENEGINNEDVKFLPPARYHYREDTKINAIGLLSASKDVRNYELVEMGIKSLGTLDLHRSLNALATIDLATDELIYKMLPNYIEASASEYRIYCAWLLRSRYGEIPAAFLIRLLLDQDTRVYRYTMKLFDTRLIEFQLLEKVLGVLEDYKNIRSWHLVNLIKLLSKRGQFMNNAYESLIKQIAAVLHILRKHSVSTIRANAYKGLLDYLGEDDIKIIQNEIRSDPDLEVQTIVVKSQIQ